MKFANIEDQYKKFPELKQEVVHELQQWTIRQLHLPNLTELEAMTFLHVCYYNEWETKNRIENYYKFRKNCPEIYRNLNIMGSDIQNAMSTLMFYPLPGRTSTGYKVFYNKFIENSSNRFNFVEALRFFACATELWILEEGNADGDILIVDMEHYTLGHISRIDINTMRKLMITLQDILPIRLKEFHFFNASPVLGHLMVLVGLFTKKSFMDKIHVHATLDTVHEHFPAEMLPEECGGQAGTRADLHRNYCQKLITNGEYFMKNDERENCLIDANETIKSNSYIRYLLSLLKWRKN